MEGSQQLEDVYFTFLLLPQNILYLFDLLLLLVDLCSDFCYLHGTSMGQISSGGGGGGRGGRGGGGGSS